MHRMMLHFSCKFYGVLLVILLVLLLRAALAAKDRNRRVFVFVSDDSFQVRHPNMETVL